MSYVAFDSAEELAAGAADHVASLIAAAPGPRVTVGLAGGSTPAAVYRELQRHQLDWERVFFWLSDERWVPWDDEQSNGKMAGENLIDHITAPYLRPRWAPWLEPSESAAHYEAELRSLHPSDHAPDVILLGMGDDGHTASLFPETEALSVTGRWYVANFVPKLDAWRLTATFALLDRARQICILVSGEGKAEMLGRVARGEDYPTTRVANGPAPVTFLVDRAAASIALQ